MKYNTTNITLTGKGFSVNDVSFRQFNLNIILGEVTFYQLQAQNEPIGWLVLDKLEMIADYTMHTDTGMKGKSTIDELHNTLIIDPEARFAELSEGDLQDLDVAEAQVTLDKIFTSKSIFNKMNHPDVKDHVDIDAALVFVSPTSNYLLVQEDETSVRIAGDDGIYVLNEEDQDENLTIISGDNGISHFGPSTNVEVNSDGIFIDDEKLDIASIMRGVAKEISNSFRNFRLDLD